MTRLKPNADVEPSRMSPAKASGAAPTLDARPSALSLLQGTAGNRAVTAMLRHPPTSPEPGYAYAGGPHGSDLVQLPSGIGNRGMQRLLQRVAGTAGNGSAVQRELSALPPILLGALAGMDVQGETILGTYLYGGGKPHDVEDPTWTAYMEDHNALRLQILAQLLAVVRDIVALKKKGRCPIAERFHAEFPENSGLSGYALLHGSNKDAGDFQLLGWADVQDAVDPAEGASDIELDLRFVFNDIVDPNKKYIMDRLRSVAANVVTMWQPTNYHLSIHWSSSCLAEVREGQPTQLSGYPSDRPRSVRPLPRAKLDLAAVEKERARVIESGIKAELLREIPSDDLAALSARKRKLLWAFYSLSGYMGSTYIERFANPAQEDDLPRLFQERISTRLRAELMDALRGKRPKGYDVLGNPSPRKPRA